MLELGETSLVVVFTSLDGFEEISMGSDRSLPGADGDGIEAAGFARQWAFRKGIEPVVFHFLDREDAR